MKPEMLKKAVALVAGRAITEASGNINPQTIAGVAESGVDYISSGWITHSAPTLDLGLDIEIKAPRRGKRP
jgi:nicotinate-nucleotide pyrophosphorylase (carboxylating)